MREESGFAMDRFKVRQIIASGGESFVKIVAILISAWLILKIIGAIIDKIFVSKGQGGKPGLVDERRLRTLSPLLKSVARYFVYFVAGTMILEELGVKTAAILAGAGIVGLAIGFGAQNLVRDIITGFFILFEDQFSVGDYVTLVNVSGVVEEMGLRVTKVRDFGGELHIIPNGAITQVTNHMGKSMLAMFDVLVPYEADVSGTVRILKTALADVRGKVEGLIEGPVVLIVASSDKVGVKLKVLARTEAMKQWDVERELKRRVREALEGAGDGSPQPGYQVIMNGDQKIESGRPGG